VQIRIRTLRSGGGIASGTSSSFTDENASKKAYIDTCIYIHIFKNHKNLIVNDKF
jgi:hypothetical protein